MPRRERDPYAADRIEREWRSFENSQEMQHESISAERTGRYQFKARIGGPAGTPYDGGSFELTIKYPRREYPYKPPKVCFKTPVWHPNVCPRTGVVWIDDLGDGCMRALLSTPEPRNWINYAAGSQYVGQRETFEATSRFWAQYFAKAPREAQDGEMSKKVLDFEAMGVSRRHALLELSNAGWDVHKATEMLFS